MIILGIDPGTNLMGYGLIQSLSREPLLITLGLLDQRKEGDHFIKIAGIFEKTLQLIDTHKPDVLSIESQFYGNNIQSMLKLGRAQGAAISAALYRKVAVFEYAPRKIKQSITGNGNASKEQIARFLSLLLQSELNAETLDATDGLAAAVCHHYQVQNPLIKTRGTSWEEFVRKNPGRLG